MKMIGIQQDKRLRRPRNVYSPSDNLNRPSHYLLYFDSTHSYNIALASSIHSITDGIATLNIRGKKVLATIITSGTFEKCEKEQRNRTRQSQQSSSDSHDEEPDDDENEGIDMSLPVNNDDSITTFPLPHRQSMSRAQNSFRSPSNDESTRSIAYSVDDDNEDDQSFDHHSRSINSNNLNTKSTISKGKRKQNRATSKTAKRQRMTNDENHDISNAQANAFANPVVVNENNSKNILNQIENSFMKFNNNIIHNMQKIERRIDSQFGSNLIQNNKFLDQYRNERTEVFPTEYIDNGIDLLETIAKDPIDFARKTLKILYSKEELKTRLLPPKRDHLRREPLDEKRFRKLLEAVRIKFRIDRGKMQYFYNELLKTKLSNFLYEERRREARKRQRDRNRVPRKTVFLVNPSDQQHSSDEGDATTA